MAQIHRQKLNSRLDVDETGHQTTDMNGHQTYKDKTVHQTTTHGEAHVRLGWAHMSGCQPAYDTWHMILTFPPVRWDGPQLQVVEEAHLVLIVRLAVETIRVYRGRVG